MDNFRQEKIVLAEQMARYEKILIQEQPELAEKFMDHAALAMYELLEEKVLEKKSYSSIKLLIGKGNNGGDAYTLGRILLKKGYDISAYQIFSEINKLSEKKADIFTESGGKIVLCKDIKELTFSCDDLIIDGILGTGFKGLISGMCADVIKAANKSKGYIFSIDIPSGLDGNTGIAEGEAIVANMTAYLGLLKTGYFLQDGYQHVGDLEYINFGMDTKEVPAYCYLGVINQLNDFLPKRGRLDHKYKIGQVCIFAGSEKMPGAAALACESAYRSGCGIVRHFYLGKVLMKIPEVISIKYSYREIEKERSRTKSILVGPGLGRGRRAKSLVNKILSLSEIPIVIDGDGLFLMDSPPRGSILTPHRGELQYIIETRGVREQQILLDLQEYSNTKRVYIIYKGMPTFIISPDDEIVVMPVGNPGMATAGSGDVLSGVIASLLAQGLSKKNASIVGVTIHGRAGDNASRKLSSQFMVASDIINEISSVFLESK